METSKKHRPLFLLSTFIKLKTYATIAAVDASENVKSTTINSHHITPSNNKNVACCICKAGHSIQNCTQLKGLTHHDKLDHLRQSDVCFGCLSHGHVSKNCKGRLTCSECNLKHPTIIHITAKLKAPSEQPSSRTTVVQKTCARTGACKQYCVHSVVPVQIKSKKGNTIIQTYAFLDSGSSATFCTEHLMQRLHLTGIKAHILLKTMAQASTVKTNVLTGLEVSGYHDDNLLDFFDYKLQWG